MLTSYHINLITIVCIHIIVVLGVSVLTGFTKLFSFGNAGFMAIGAYASALMTMKLNMPFIFSIIISSLLAGIIAYLLGSITLKLEGDYFLIATLGFGECVRVLLTYIEPITGGAKGLSGIPKYTTPAIAIGSAILAFVLSWTLIHSRFGRNFTAIREQEVAAEAVGIKAFKYKRMAFVYSALLAGWAGALYAHNLRYLVPTAFNLAQSSEYTITVVIGGLGSLTGAVLGALLINLLPEVFRFISSYRMVLYGVAVVAVIVFKPNGLCGYKEFSITKLVKCLKTWIRRVYEWVKKKISRKEGES